MLRERLSKMTDEIRDQPAVRETAKEAGALLLAVGGLAAAFGAASCCAIPGLLGGLGLSSAWLTGIAIFTAPHRIALVAAAVISLVGAGAVLAWYRRALACAPDRALRQISSDIAGHWVCLAWGRAHDRRLLLRMILTSVVTCPSCGHPKSETMPTDACQFFYECEGCRTLLKPKPGDCCVFCSFGSVPCPQIQSLSN